MLDFWSVILTSWDPGDPLILGRDLNKKFQNVPQMVVKFMVMNTIKSNP